MVRHPGADHHALRRSGRVRLVGVARLAGREVDRVVVAVSALDAELRQPREVADGRLRTDGQRERRGVGRDDEVVGQAALHAQSRDAERLVLIRLVTVDDAVGRFGDPPRHAVLPAVLDLAAHHALVGRVEQRLRKGFHEEYRHQVLEHRCAPRQQRGCAGHAHGRPAQPEPMPLRHVAARDGKEARQARFRGEQVVVRRIEPARLFGVGQPVADREQLAGAVVQEAEMHLVGQRTAPLRQREQPPGQSGQRGRARQPQQALAQRGGPGTRLGGQAGLRVRLVERLVECAQRVGGKPRRPSGFGALRQIGDHPIGRRAQLEQCGGRLGRQVVGQRRRGAYRVGRIDEAGHQLRLALRPRGNAGQAAGQCDERADEVAAVDGRHVGGPQRRKRLRVVPVEQVTFVPLERIARIERVVHTFDELLGRQQPQVVGRKRGEQTHADVGRRGALRQYAVAGVLEVVGRQPVCVGPDERLEVVPGLARDAAQLDTLIVIQIGPLGARRLAQPEGDGWRRRPDEQEGQRDEPRRSR